MEPIQHVMLLKLHLHSSRLVQQGLCWPYVRPAVVLPGFHSAMAYSVVALPCCAALLANLVSRCRSFPPFCRGCRRLPRSAHRQSRPSGLLGSPLNMSHTARCAQQCSSHQAW